jgi:hypothetical protein
MSDSGKHLERLVSEIESLLAPQGFKIELRERAFNDNGVQIAEFDIIISGKIGSSPIKVLIECRDRPSEGPAPGSWIEQLVGRRHRFGFDKVVAVSTTGFAEGAKEFANQSGIELRALSELETGLIASWFRAYFLTRHAVPVQAKLIPARYPNQSEIDLELSFVISGVDIKTPILTREAIEDDKLPLSLLDVWKRVVDNNPQVFDSLEVNGQAKLSIIVVMFEEFDGHKPPPIRGDKTALGPGPASMIVGFDDVGLGFDVKAGKMPIRVAAIEFHGKFRLTSEIKSASKVYDYSRYGEGTIATTVYFDMGDNEAMFIVSRQEGA